MEKMPPGFTSMFLTMQTRPVLSWNLASYRPGVTPVNAKPLVVVDSAVAIIHGLIRSVLVGPGRREIELRYRVRRQIPESDTLALSRCRSKCVRSSARFRNSAADLALALFRGIRAFCEAENIFRVRLK